MKTIVYQGLEGSFSYITAKRLFGSSVELVGLPSFREVYEKVLNGNADIALLPIENTLAGTVYETIDLICKGALHIIGVTKTQIQQSLLALPGSSLQKIRKALSHTKALEQCDEFFVKHPWIEKIPYYDTAGAAAAVAKNKDDNVAAIAHRETGAIYGLNVLEQGIEDHAENFTRFLLLSKEKSRGNRHSVCFAVEHRPGSLKDLLIEFTEQKANITYIVSRPMYGKPFEYLFYIEFEAPGSINWEKLNKKALFFQNLGSYDELL